VSITRGALELGRNQSPLVFAAVLARDRERTDEHVVTAGMEFGVALYKRAGSVSKSSSRVPGYAHVGVSDLGVLHFVYVPHMPR